jgi:hypothetical protein
MKNWFVTCAALAACAVPFVAGGANAALVTELVTFSANTFQEYTSPGYTPASPPEDPVTGSFIITFDPTLTYNDSTDITLKSLNIDLGSTLVFSYSPMVATYPDNTFPAGTLRVGGVAGAGGGLNGSDVVNYAPSDSDFWLYIYNFNTTPAFEQVGYAQTSTDGNLYYTINESGTVEVSPYTAPEPATWAMMLLGFAGLGFLGYRKRAALAAA